MLKSDLRGRFENALLAHDLKGLVDELKREGLTQVAIYCILDDLRLEVDSQNRGIDEEQVADALDFVCGFCSPDKCWFHHTLSDDEITIHRQMLETTDLATITGIEARLRRFEADPSNVWTWEQIEERLGLEQETNKGLRRVLSPTFRPQSRST